MACRAVEDASVALVPDAVARLAVDGPAVCVALSYHRSAALSFEVHAATVDERAALAAIDARAAWSQAGFEAGTGIDLDEAGPVRQELALLDAGDLDSAAGSEVGRRLLCSVAARLNRRDWSDTLPVADDFVVYAVRLRSRSTNSRSTACLPPDRLVVLTERGLL